MADGADITGHMRRTLVVCAALLCLGFTPVPPEPPAPPDTEAGAGGAPAAPGLVVVSDRAAFTVQVCERIERSARAHGLPPAFLAKLIWKESWFDPNAISPKGAEGIAQFMPATAAKWGLENAFDPMAAIAASAELLGHLARGYGNLGLAAAAYNAGERRVDAYLAGRSGLPRETRDYVAAITGRGADAWKRTRDLELRFVLDETRPFQDACAEMPVYKAPLQKRFANTYFNRALRLVGKQDYADAILRYSVAIRLKSDFPDAYNNRGIAYRRLGDFASAIANYDVAIRLKPDYAAAYNNRGYALRKLGRYDEAVADYDRAIKHKPEYVAALFNRGYALAQLGRFEAAVADYTRALRHQPKHVLALYNRALARVGLDQLAKARADLDRAISLKPEFAKAYFRRALLFRRIGDDERARADYRRSVALEARFAHGRYVRMFD